MGDTIARFYYVYGNLETNVQAMVLPQLADAETQGVWEYNTILDQLARVFENPNQQQEAEDALHNIRQGDKESLPSYMPNSSALSTKQELRPGQTLSKRSYQSPHPTTPSCG